MSLNEKLDVLLNEKIEVKRKYLQKGVIIAFKITDKITEEKYLSAKIEEIIDNDNFLVVTKNGTRYKINITNIAWAKTGKRWPKGVYEKLKGRRRVIVNEQ